MNFNASCAELVRVAGYGLIPDVFSTVEIGALLDDLGRASLPRSRAGVRHAMKNTSVAQIAGDPRLMQIARQILGDAAFPFRATLFEKLPDSNWLVAWHQDTALPLVERVERDGWGPWSVKDGVIYAHAPAAALEQVVALRLHLDDSTEKNGPLRVLPETQQLGVLTDDQLHALSESAKPVDCLMSLGGVVAMRPLIIHASSKSQADIPRRVLHIEYAASASPADGLQLAIA
jgi:ectoine hydroxylase-related dioxygenase (phytanoyl-CoA dioxygenase family)